MKRWPPLLTTQLAMVLPVIIGQILQRLFHIVDNRFVAQLGTDALVLHNVQYTFIVFGQFLGVAAATSALVFWKRPENKLAQLFLLRSHLLLSGLVGIICFGIFVTFADLIFGHFGVPSTLNNRLGKTYFGIGLLNMVLQGLFGTLDGFLIASNRQRIGLLLAGLQVTLNIGADAYAVSWAHRHGDLMTPLLIIGLSTTLLLIATSILAYRSVFIEEKTTLRLPFRTIFPVLRAEMGVALLRACVPIAGVWLFARIEGSSNFLVTHNLALHLSYLFCLPLIASSQIAVKEASHNFRSTAWREGLFYTGILPTTVLLLFAAFFSTHLIGWVYDYQIPADHTPYLVLFFLACAIGQFANALSVPLRAKKQSFRITRHFAIAEYGVWLGGILLLTLVHRATPTAIGWATIGFASMFLFLNARSVKALGT